MTKPDSKPQRLYQRVRPNSPSAAQAQIIVGPKQPVIGCRLIDYSPGGACLEIFPMVQVPERFELLHGGVKKKSRVVWRRGSRIGVAF
ncbi:PilZ domain-containing protein [Bradyrhizobium sp.]|uniref:PilZ domain-containing protein n=1 Tax=Bradyrhizobium sp. TaxID=376 RepID=UPI0026177764|nr:PilZ domain-containing protein [Bradyrhizobium sp.]